MKYARFIVAVFIAGATALAGHAQTPEDQCLDSDGVRIRYIEKGEGEPLILLHGFCANLDLMWLLPGLVDKFASDYRVIAMDCRGHGKSDKPHDPEAYGDEMVNDVIRLMDSLKIEQAHLLGYSMGGMIAFKTMTMHPDRVISALPCGFGWAPPGEDNELMLETLAKALEEHGSIRPLMEFLAAEDEVLDEAQLEQTDQLIRLMNDTKALAAVARGMAKLRPDEERLKANTIPAMAIVGSRDPLHKAAQSMLGRMPNLEVTLIDGGDHMTTFSDPEFTRSIRSFLSKHSLAAAEKK